MSLLKTLMWLVLTMSATAGWGTELTMVLDVTIDPSLKRLSGVARLSGGSKDRLALSVANLSDVTVDGKKAAPAPDGTIEVPSGSNGTATVRYEAAFDLTAGQRSGNYMDAQNVFLMAGWYPQPAGLARYTLSVTLPEGFTAVSEAESVVTASAGGLTTHLFYFNHPLEGLHLAASANYVVSKASHNGIAIETFFFKEDASLADTYIDHTKQYLERYERLLAPFPYKRFAVVENVLPTGYSMPTFTLLGKQVVNLPFIVKTSLAHEIVHQWFGNHVYIDPGQGNWAEGLATYLSDYLLEEEQGRGKAYRKRILVEYGAYVGADNAMALSDFRFRRNKAEGAVGYGRAAMFFHDLRRHINDQVFFEALVDFIASNRYRKASWDDLCTSFATVSGEPLEAYCDTWTARPDIPGLSVLKSDLEIRDGAPVLSFTLQQQAEPFVLKVPVQVHSETCVKTLSITMGRKQQDFTLPLEQVPTKVILDQDHDLMRRLTPAEIPPVLAHIMGRDRLTFVVTDDALPVYRPLMQALGNPEIDTVSPEALTFARLKASTLVICGRDNPLAAALVGKRTAAVDAGLSIDVWQHPYNENSHILFAHADSETETRAVLRSLRHYGQYSRLTFAQGKVLAKKTAHSEDGIVIHQQSPTLALRPGQVPTLEKILDGLAGHRVVYVGEKHDRHAHHMNQLEIIRHLFSSGAELAVGMEMFHQPYQAAVNSYLEGGMDERTFLRESAYYREWGYDYGLYKPILDFLKANRIPLVALNIPGDVTKQVARQGIESLDQEQRTWVPEDLDFSDADYRRDLKQVFDLHGSQTDIQNFDYFLQAQVLWDEGMAARAFRFLEAHPGHILVVLAGNGHIRYGYGIPRRLFRRLGEAYTMIVQDEPLEAGIADHVLITTDVKGKTAPKLGVMVEETDRGLTITGVGHEGPAVKAGLEKGDLIRSFDGQPIETLADLRLALFYCQKDQTTSIQILRGDQTLAREITL